MLICGSRPFKFQHISRFPWQIELRIRATELKTVARSADKRFGCRWRIGPNWDFLAHSEKLNARIMREFAAAGIHFALPATVTRLTRDEGSSPSGFDS